MVQLGKKAPEFKLPTDGGGTIALKDLKGQKVVLYFYPKDDTPGCTVEACDFTAGIRDFEKLYAVVLGVSPDSTESHRKFVAKHAIPRTTRRAAPPRPRASATRSRRSIRQVP